MHSEFSLHWLYVQENSWNSVSSHLKSSLLKSPPSPLHLSTCWLITNWSLPGGQVTNRPHLTSASGCSPLSAAPLSSAQLSSTQLSWAPWPARDDKSPSQPVLIGGPGGLYKGKEGGDWLCFTENIITPLNAGGPTEFPRPRNGDDHPGREYMTWLTEALSPIWKPNCEA